MGVDSLQQAVGGGARREKNRKGQFSLHVSPPLHWGDFLAAEKSYQQFPAAIYAKYTTELPLQRTEPNENDTLRPCTAIMLNVCKAPNHTHTPSLFLSLSL